MQNIKAKILLVEDDNLVRDMLTQVLQRASHTVICAIDGETPGSSVARLLPCAVVPDRATQPRYSIAPQRSHLEASSSTLSST